MTAWRSFGAVCVLLVAVRAGWGQTYTLAETPQAGDCFRIGMRMTLSGEIRITKDGKVEALPLTATAIHEYPERTLSVDSGRLPNKTARIYERAEATITVQGETSKRIVRPERRFCVAQ